MKIKVITYNIKEGFCDKDKSKNYKINKNRMQSGIKLIREEDPDLLVIIEACFRNKNKYGIKQDYKKMFGYKHEAYGSNKYKHIEWGVLILSKYPILKHEDYSIKHAGFVRAIIKIKGKNIVVDAVHPDPYHDEHQRMQWFKSVIRDKSKNYILAGDFNAFSHQDNYNKNRLIKGFKEYFKKEEKHKAKEIVGDILTSKTIKFLIRNNLVDTFKKKNRDWDFSYHTDLSKNKYDFSRLDYIFCSPNFNILNSGIIKNELVEKASDHYPIYAILKI